MVYPLLGAVAELQELTVSGSLQKACASTRTLVGTEVRFPPPLRRAPEGAKTPSPHSPGRPVVRPPLCLPCPFPHPPRTSRARHRPCAHRLLTITTGSRLHRGLRCPINRCSKVANHRIQSCRSHLLAACHLRLRCAAGPHRRCILALRLARRTGHFLDRLASAPLARIAQPRQPTRSRPKATR